MISRFVALNSYVVSLNLTVSLRLYSSNDTNHVTWSNIVGCMNGGARRRLTGFNYGDTLVAREYAAQHRVLMTDSFTEYQRNLSISPKWVLQDVEHLKSIARP